MFFLLVAAGCWVRGDAVNAPLSSKSSKCVLSAVRGVGLFVSLFVSSRKWISKFDHNNAFLFCFSLPGFVFVVFLLACL